jgi:hypothetical protein
MDKPKLNLRLKYLKQEPNDTTMDAYPAQPVVVKLKGNKTLTKLVPILSITEMDKCIGCVAENTFDKPNPRIDCFDLPKCDGAIYVRATPTTLLHHIKWRLENDQ